MLEAYSVSHGKASPYLPVIELLKSYFRFSLRTMNGNAGRRSLAKCLMLDRSLEDTLPYLFALLGIEEQPSPLQQMDPQIRRRRTFEALKKLFLRESLNQPLILVFEDLHWIDSETQGFLDVLSESVASAKLLLLITIAPSIGTSGDRRRTTPSYAWRRSAKPKPKNSLRCFRVGADRTAQALQTAPLQTSSLILEKTEGTPFFHGRGGAGR